MKKVKVIPTGIMSHKIPSRKSAAERIRKELAINKETKIVFFAGILNPRKRVEDVLHVAKQCQEENILFLIAGDGPSKEQLEKKAQSKNVRFLGWRKDLLTLMQAADVFLFPSSAEGLPGVIMEAMYCETPIVTTRIPCTTDLIRHRKEGLLCNVGDVKMMTKSVKELLQSKNANRVTKKAKRRVQEEFSWDSVLPLYEALYDQNIHK